MSILDVTEDQIFHTLGRGKDPNFKPIEKVRPVIPPKPKKTYPVHQTIKPAQSMAMKASQAVAEEPEKPIPSPEVDEAMKKLTEELCELNNRVNGIQTMVKWYIVPQFVVVLALLLMLFLKS